jgi:hypothetical protein
MDLTPLTDTATYRSELRQKWTNLFGLWQADAGGKWHRYHKQYIPAQNDQSITGKTFVDNGAPLRLERKVRALTLQTVDTRVLHARHTSVYENTVGSKAATVRRRMRERL